MFTTNLSRHPAAPDIQGLPAHFAHCYSVADFGLYGAVFRLSA